MYQNTPIFSDVSCVFPSGKISTIIGESGVGKTTLLKTIVGLIPLHHGSISIDQRDITTVNTQQRAELIGYVFQEFNLFRHLTALDNCIDPLRVHGFSYEEAHARAVHELTALGMMQYADKYPSALSGGQKQRIAIARALCLNPKILLLDEPTASLDPKNTQRLVTILRNLTQQGLTVILSSQDMPFVQHIADTIYLVSNGTIQAYDPRHHAQWFDNHITQK